MPSRLGTACCNELVLCLTQSLMRISKISCSHLLAPEPSRTLSCKNETSEVLRVTAGKWWKGIRKLKWRTSMAQDFIPSPNHFPNAGLQHLPLASEYEEWRSQNVLPCTFMEEQYIIRPTWYFCWPLVELSSPSIGYHSWSPLPAASGEW